MRLPTTTATGPVARARTTCIRGLKTRPRSQKSWTRCRGLVTTNPLDATPSTGSTSSGNSLSVASLTAATPLDHLVFVAAGNGTAGTWSAASGMTTRAQQVGGTTDTAIIDQRLNQAAPTGTRVATHSTTSGLTGALIVLRPMLTTTLSYDSQGNRTAVTPATGPSTTYAYDQANRLTSFTTGSTSATYAYDGTGLRISKTVNGTSTAFTWDETTSTPALLVEGTTKYVYGPQGLPLEQVTSSNTYFFHHDQIGSTRALTDSNGTVAATYTYDPYGRMTAHTGTLTNPLLFAGEYQDDESGLVYLRARYYDPTTAQFLTRDPVEAFTQQPYQYAAGDPLDLSDPSGLCNKNPFSGGFWTHGNCLSDAATYVYNTDVDWYRCHGGWKTFASIAIGSSLVAAGALLTSEVLLPAAGAAEVALGSEGALGAWEWATHVFTFLAPGLGLGGAGGLLAAEAASQPGCGCE